MFLMVLTIVSLQSFSQNTCDCYIDSVSKLKVISFTDNMPEFEGGNQELMKFIMKNFKLPEKEMFQASYSVQFIVTKKGNVVYPRIYNKVEISKSEKLLIDVFNSMPKWDPGTCFGKKVNVLMTYSFKI